VQCIEPQFYARFVEKLGVANDAAFAQTRDPDAWPELARRIADILASKPLQEWADIFADSDACVAPVLDPATAAHDPHLAARGTWTRIDGRLQASRHRDSTKRRPACHDRPRGAASTPRRSCAALASTSSLLKREFFRQAASGTGMCRHFRWP
jgi:crotonobetainyl-CoA:carnitine CoA-transferase CaiB-like acyl-CoA transferase